MIEEFKGFLRRGRSGQIYRHYVGIILMSVLFAGCAATHSQGQQGSAYHPPDASTLHSTGTPPPTSGPVPVSLSADGFFTPEGMRISFLRECAEATLKSGYDSFALFHYSMQQTAKES